MHLVNKFFHQTGLTLIELVMTIVILSVGVTGVLFAYQANVRHSADPMVYQQAIAIAKSYLEEILEKTFPPTVPCPAPPGGGRSTYSTVCDYSGLADVGAYDQTGAAVSGLNKYNVNVAVATSGVVLGALASGTEVVRVDVTVTHPNLATSVVLSGYRTLY